MRRCAWCKGRVRWDDPMPNAIQVNAEDALPHQIKFIVGLWGEVKAGTMQGGACRKCHAKLTGQPEPSPVLYGSDNQAPERVIGLRADGRCDGDAYPVCGICRQALYEGDGLLPIRIQAEDLDLPSDVLYRVRERLAQGDKKGARAFCAMYGAPMPGAPQACPECLAKYKPRVLSRLHEAGLFLGVTSPEHMSRGMLL